MISPGGSGSSFKSVILIVVKKRVICLLVRQPKFLVLRYYGSTSGFKFPNCCMYKNWFITIQQYVGASEFRSQWPEQFCARAKTAEDSSGAAHIALDRISSWIPNTIFIHRGRAAHHRGNGRSGIAKALCCRSKEGSWRDVSLLCGSNFRRA